MKLRWTVLVPLLVLAGGAIAYADVPNTFKDGDTLSADKVNQNFQALVDLTTDQSIAGKKTFTGSVGVGTSTPASKVSIWAANPQVEPQAATLALGLRPDGLAATLGLWFSSTLGWAEEVDSTGDLNFWAYNDGAWARQVTFEHASGRVGIGTSTPAALLEVAGNDTTPQNGISSSRGHGAHISLRAVSGLTFTAAGSSAHRPCSPASCGLPRAPWRHGRRPLRAARAPRR